MELDMKSQSIKTGLESQIEQLTLTQQPASFQAGKFKSDFPQKHLLVHHVNVMDEFLNDSSPVNADPMLSS